MSSLQAVGPTDLVHVALVGSRRAAFGRLYECKRIIEAHGGSTRVDSEPGRGACMVIELPPWSGDGTPATPAAVSGLGGQGT